MVVLLPCLLEYDYDERLLYRINNLYYEIQRKRGMVNVGRIPERPKGKKITRIIKKERFLLLGFCPEATSS